MDIGEFATAPEVVTEAIVVIDLVDSARTSNLFGWHAVGRGLLRDLRTLIAKIGQPRGLRCMKSTGDGYLVTFHDAQSAERAVIHAVDTVFELMSHIAARNRDVPEERTLKLRSAIHFGEVDVVSSDREGPHISYTFRLEAISRASLPEALNPIAPDELPLQNYVLCSEETAEILERRATQWKTISIGLLKLKGFTGWREVFRILPTQ